MKIVFMGTPELAAGVLQALYEAGHEIAAVVTSRISPKEEAVCRRCLR